MTQAHHEFFAVKIRKNYAFVCNHALRRSFTALGNFLAKRGAESIIGRDNAAIFLHEILVRETDIEVG
jgi:hypothetical protein